MAGTIDFGNGTSWECSGGAFRGMVAGVCDCLDDSAASMRVRKQLIEAASSVMYVQYDRDFDPQMEIAFLHALELHCGTR